MSSLSSLSIHRPVLATVLSLIIILFGIIGLTRLSIREYPDIDLPTITVTTTYIGANAEVIQTQITEPLEESINGIDGIRSLTSISAEGRSSITVEFKLGKNLEAAANDVRDRVSRAMRNLPPDANVPIIVKADANTSAIVLVNVRSAQLSLLDLSDLASRMIKDRLQTIPGVSEVQIWGEKRYAMRLRIDPQKMAILGLTPMDIRLALEQENLELPSGRLEGENTELTIRTLSRLATAQEFNRLILRETANQLIRLEDIGYAELAPENERTLFRSDGIPMVGVALVPLPGANTIAIVDELHRRLEILKKEIPPGVEIKIGFDLTRFVRQSIREVRETILIAFILVILIIFFFLKNWRTSLIPIVVIPISLIGAFFIMYLFDFSINILTLLSLVLAIGLVVDDAIVVMENIYQKTEAGFSSIEAATAGASEVFFAVISTTVTLVAIFFPIVFMEGITGRLFREFSIVLAGSVIISSFVALTLAPMLCSRILHPPANNAISDGDRNGETANTGRTPFIKRLTGYYRQSLEMSIDRSKWNWTILALISLLVIIFWRLLPSELAPLDDRSTLRFSAIAPEGTTFTAMDQQISNLVAYVMERVPEREVLLSNTAPGHGGAPSVNQGNMRLMLLQPDRRNRSQKEIFLTLSRELRQFNNIRVIPSQEATFSGVQRGSSLPVQFVVKAPSQKHLAQSVPEFFNLAKSSSAFSAVDVNLKFNKPEAVIRIDRDMAATLGVSARDISQTLQLLYSGLRYGFFIKNEKQYDIIGEAQYPRRNDPGDLLGILVRGKNGQLIRLDNLVHFTESIRSPQFYRYDRWASATFSANLSEGFTIDDGIREMERIATETLDSSYTTTLTGLSKDYRESSGSLNFVLILSLALIYLVLAAQFESFVDPLIIMGTVPLALAGSLLFLFFFNQTLNVFSQIGQIMLIGLATKNGILIVEFANQRRQAGISLREAIIDATAKRFRPILMTSISTILGALPIAISLGSGSASRAPMGIAIIGGMLFSTFLSLYLIPFLYLRFNRDQVQ